MSTRDVGVKKKTRGSSHRRIRKNGSTEQFLAVAAHAVVEFWIASYIQIEAKMTLTDYGDEICNIYIRSHIPTPNPFIIRYAIFVSSARVVVLGIVVLTWMLAWTLPRTLTRLELLHLSVLLQVFPISALITKSADGCCSAPTLPAATSSYQTCMLCSSTTPSPLPTLTFPSASASPLPPSNTPLSPAKRALLPSPLPHPRPLPTTQTHR
jgi:hypothetical protein